jgi:outer membrane immunogenic protein
MKKLLSSGVMLALLAGPALAADLPRTVAPAPVFVPAVPAFSWTGFYAGINAGYGFGTQENRDPTVIGVPASTNLFSNIVTGAPTTGVVAFSNRNSNTDGFVGGGQIGYNYMFGASSGVVVGIEADAQYVDFGRNRNTGTYATPAGADITPGARFFNPNGLSSLDYFGTVRGRLGYAFGQFLAYGTGGFAYGSGGGDEFGLTNRSRNDFATGWTAGGGIEYALPTNSFLNFFNSSAVTLKVEGLYVNLDQGRNDGSFAVNPAGAVVGTYTPGTTLVSGPTARNTETEFAVVRAGINYKFGTSGF